MGCASGPTAVGPSTATCPCWWSTTPPPRSGACAPWPPTSGCTSRACPSATFRRVASMRRSTTTGLPCRGKRRDMNETASAVAGGAERARPWRPLMQASRHAVASGHYLASVAGLRTLERGGNAIDAGVATGVCLNVLLPDWTNFGGVAPIIVYLAGSGEVATISGVGRWPRRARLEYFRDELGAIPDGVQNAVVPAACDAWLTALALYGRLTLAAVLAPAIELAEEGFPVNADLAQHLAAANA